MPSTYTLIKGETITTAVAGYSFTAIQSTFTDLVVRVSAKGDNEGGVNGTFRMQFNSDSGFNFTNYKSTRLNGSGSSASSSRSTERISVVMSGQTADGFGSAEVYIPNYLSTVNKPMSAFGVAESNTANVNMAATAGLYLSSAGITTVTVYQDSGTNFVAGSSFYLYGIKNS